MGPSVCNVSRMGFQPVECPQQSGLLHGSRFLLGALQEGRCPMSMTKVAPIGVPPTHIFDLHGRLVNGEVSAQDLDELQWSAECEGYDLESECLTRYGYGSRWLTLAQYSEILRAIVQRRAAAISAT